MNELKCSSHTSVDWFNFHRDICNQWITAHPAKIGGLNEDLTPKTVEIDESFYFHRKYGRGAWHEGFWCFGGIERENPHNIFIVQVPNRRRETLEALIDQYIDYGMKIK
jgi:hypothetical protein